MINGQSVLAVIPARGGSKRLPRKNIIDLAGKPLISYSIDAGSRSRYIDELIVSTDDLEIAQIASQYGADVPFVRPNKLAVDESSTVDVVIHAVDFFATVKNKKFDYILLLQPTSPLRDDKDIDSSFEILISTGADAIVSVCEVDHNPFWVNTLPPDLSMVGFIQKDILNMRSQDLPLYYRLNGAIYICRVERLIQEKTFILTSKIFAYIMPKEKSIDVDTLLDYKICEMLIKEGRTGLNGN